MSDATIEVLKFGSSVLPDTPAVTGPEPNIVREIRRELRRGRRVLAVVSAIGATTSKLHAEALEIDETPDEEAVASLLATGEARSAALLVLALGRAGISARVLDPRRIDLCTRGPALDAAPRAVDASVIREAYTEVSVVIVPGFVGVSESGATTLLGRGGSDLTALFLAHRLGARCRLIKDVDGLYDRDPNAAPRTARRYRTIRCVDALRLDASVVQSKAIRYAQRHGLTFTVRGMGASSAGTEVGASATSFAPRGRRGAARQPRIALLGHGTVGAGVRQALTALGLAPATVLVRDPSAHPELPRGVVAASPEPVADADLVIEVLGGLEPARDLVTGALRRGAPVVTANKALIAAHGPMLADLGTPLRWGAAVGGAVPVLEVLRARNEPVRTLCGVLNGTSNAVLELLERGVSLDRALDEARRGGLCERDASLDLDGVDAAHKAIIIGRAAFGPRWGVADVPRDVIDATTGERCVAARARDRSLRQVVELDARGARVTLIEVPRDSAFGRLRGAGNAVCIDWKGGTCDVLTGRGAGRWPTAGAVVADVIDLVGSFRGARVGGRT